LENIISAAGWRSTMGYLLAEYKYPTLLADAAYALGEVLKGSNKLLVTLRITRYLIYLSISNLIIMITPNAFHLIIKHFDEIDKRVSAKFHSARPWDEPSLTAEFCDMLDINMQRHEKISYTLDDLNKDLRNDSGLFGMNLSIQTNQFSAIHERYMSQSDIGLQMIYENNIEPDKNVTKYFLLQAKRIFPIQGFPAIYSERSAFSSVNKEQEDRIAVLKSWVGNGLKYLLYCPRPENLDVLVAEKLNYYRIKKLHVNIFDYIKGQEIREDLKVATSTTSAGIFVAKDIAKVRTLKEVHEKIFDDTDPFSWFIASLFLESNPHSGYLPEEFDMSEQEVIRRILQGEPGILTELSREFTTESRNVPNNFTIYPATTITLRYSIGENLEAPRPIVQ